MPVFRTSNGTVEQLTPWPFADERDLQRFFEANLEVLLGVVSLTLSSTRVRSTVAVLTRSGSTRKGAR